MICLMFVLGIDVLSFLTLMLKSAGFSAAADATRVSVVIGVFKVFVKI